VNTILKQQRKRIYTKTTNMDKKYGASKKTEQDKKNKQAKRARKAQKREDRKAYGRGEKGRAAKMEATAKKAAIAKAERASQNAMESTSGPSMNRYDKDMMHERELISDAKKEIHKEDVAKKSHAHPILKHMKRF